MKMKWAYKVEIVKPPVFANTASKAEFIAETLNRRGLDGWELVTAPIFPGTTSFQMIFKRSV